MTDPRQLLSEAIAAPSSDPNTLERQQAIAASSRCYPCGRREGAGCWQVCQNRRTDPAPATCRCRHDGTDEARVIAPR